MKLTKEQDMPLLARKRQTFTVELTKEATPTRLDMRKQIAKHNKASEELVSIRHVYQRFGQGKAKVIAHIYSDVKVAQKLDPVKKKDQEKLKKESEAKEAAKAEAQKAAEAPKEEPKAEAAPEQPKAEESPEEKKDETK